MTLVLLTARSLLNGSPVVDGATRHVLRGHDLRLCDYPIWQYVLAARPGNHSSVYRIVHVHGARQASWQAIRRDTYFRCRCPYHSLTVLYAESPFSGPEIAARLHLLRPGMQIAQ